MQWLTIVVTAALAGIAATYVVMQKTKKKRKKVTFAAEWRKSAVQKIYDAMKKGFGAVKEIQGAVKKSCGAVKEIYGEVKKILCRKKKKRVSFADDCRKPALQKIYDALKEIYGAVEKRFGAVKGNGVSPREIKGFP